MVKAPENDNLVMESIEDLYLQADGLHADTDIRATHIINDDKLERTDSKLRPIIGSLPVTLQKKGPVSELSDMVLMGQKVARQETESPLLKQAAENRPPSADKTTAEHPSSPQAVSADEPENPFLAIRQAVISAGDAEKSLQSESDQNDPQQDILNRPFSQKGTFGDQIAQLIEQEIEKRLQARTRKSMSKQKSKARGKKPSAKKSLNKTKTVRKKTTKSKTTKQAKTK